MIQQKCEGCLSSEGLTLNHISALVPPGEREAEKESNVFLPGEWAAATVAGVEGGLLGEASEQNDVSAGIEKNYW